MTQLNQEKCVACRRDSPPVEQEEVAELHAQVSDWDLISEDGISKLDRVFKFNNFQHALDFTNATFIATISLWLPSPIEFTEIWWLTILNRFSWGGPPKQGWHVR